MGARLLLHGTVGHPIPHHPMHAPATPTNQNHTHLTLMMKSNVIVLHSSDAFTVLPSAVCSHQRSRYCREGGGRVSKTEKVLETRCQRGSKKGGQILQSTLPLQCCHQLSAHTIAQGDVQVTNSRHADNSKINNEAGNIILGRLSLASQLKAMLHWVTMCDKSFQGGWMT
jgi:hypothetical protein